MKLISLLLLTTIVTYTARATDTVRTARPHQPYNAIKLGATTVSMRIPMLILGLEHRWNHFSWHAGTGFLIPKRYVIDNTIRGTSSGYTLRLDGRLHNHTPDHSGVYIGAGLFYTWFKHPHVGYFSDSQQNMYRRDTRDEYLLIKHTVGLVVQFGGHHYIGKRFDIDTWIGVGPKVVFTSQRGRTDPTHIYYTRHPEIDAMESRLGTTWAAALQAQISVGYILGK